MANKEGAREAHNLAVGNVPELTEFSGELPEYSMNFDLPFYYSEHPALAYPLYMLSRNKAQNFKVFTLRNKIWDLLRMCIKGDDGTWQTVPAKQFRDRLEFVNDTLPPPRIWGRYAVMTEGEKACNAGKSKSYIIRNVMSVNTDNKFKLGSTQALDLGSISAPCLAIFWVAENATATEYNCHSNYTTHESVPERKYARNPISTSTLKYTKHPQGSSGVGALCFEDLPSDHFTSVSFRRHLPSQPTEIGHHCWSFAQDLGGYMHGERALSLAALGAKLSCTFWKPPRTSHRRNVENNRDLEVSMSDSASIAGSSSPEISDTSNIEQLMKAEFSLHTRLLIQRELLFEHLPDKTVIKLI